MDQLSIVLAMSERDDLSLVRLERTHRVIMARSACSRVDVTARLEPLELRGG